jgi:alcohol dehydrogenase (cytochrome c)
MGVSFGTSARWGVIAGVLAGGALLVTAALPARGAADYTAAQAAAGDSVYRAQCSSCHGARLQGGAGPALAGAPFQTSLKNNYTSFALLEGFIQKQMPANAPGSLSHAQYVDVSAFILAQQTAKAASQISAEIVRAAPPTTRTFMSMPSTSDVTISDSMLMGAGGDQNDWLMGGHTYANDRYSSLDQITTDNVANLTPVAIVQTGYTASFETTPVVVNGVMYASTPTVNNKMKILALDATSGARIWETTYNLGNFKICCGPVNRGVAVAYGKVYVLTLDDHLVALDARTGAQRWSVQVANPSVGYSETMTPTIYQGAVIVGSAGGEWAIRGFVASYDANTGKQRWRWNSTDPKSFSGNSWKAGGGMVWTTPAVDPVLGLVIFSTGNPNPDLSGINRKGDNLYTDSIVALDPKTGKLRWYFQFTPHDVHDFDAMAPPSLIDAMWEGKPRKLMVQANRNGFLYVLDRTDGKFLLGRPFTTALTWASGLTPEGRPIIAPGHEPTHEGTVSCPWLNGASNWYSTSYDPLTSLYYVQTNDKCGIFTRTDMPYKQGRGYMGGSFSPVPGDPGRRVLRAFDIHTGKAVWELPQTGAADSFGGVLSTAGGVVLYGADDGSFAAADAKTGKPLWSFQTSQSPHASPMTYLFDNKQYVAVASGSNIIAFGLPN